MADRSEEFFVGYLPVSATTRRALTRIALIVFASTALLAGAAASFREGAAATEARANASVLGRMDARGYGVLLTYEQGVLRPILLSRGGKFGSPPRLRALDGKIVRLTGLLLERSGVRLMEVYQVDERPALRDEERARYGALRLEPSRVTRARGEIVDSKCWLGRMKPGDGRTHRACAQLCIAGGMPPLLITSEGQALVLVAEDGSAIGDDVIPFVAEPVEVEGALERAGELTFLKLDPRTVRRL